jgi:hypothetical protein
MTDGQVASFNLQSEICNLQLDRGPSSMMELKVILDFACCACHEGVSVTVKCEGKGLALGSRTVASVSVPCPGCGTIHRLDFDTSGTLRAVRPEPGPRPLLEPSLN